MSAAHVEAGHPDEAGDDARQLLDELESLLNRQLQLVRRGELSVVGTLMQETEALVAKVTHLGVHGTPEFERRRERLQRLCDTLSLVLTTARSAVDGEIKQIRQGQKVLATYRRNLVKT